MKKSLTTLATAATFLSAAPFALAVNVATCPAGTFNPLCTFSISGNFIPGLISILFIIAIIVAVLYLIWGGIKWIMSGGDKAALQAAREHVIAAIVGLVVVFLSYFLLNFVLSSFLGIGSTTAGFDLPSLR